MATSEDIVRKEVARVARLAAKEVHRGNQALHSNQEFGDTQYHGSAESSTHSKDASGSKEKAPRNVSPDIQDSFGESLRSPISPSLGSSALVLENNGILVAEPQYRLTPPAATSAAATPSLASLLTGDAAPPEGMAVERQPASMAPVRTELSASPDITLDGAGNLAAAVADRLRVRAGGAENMATPSGPTDSEQPSPAGRRPAPALDACNWDSAVSPGTSPSAPAPSTATTVDGGKFRQTPSAQAALDEARELSSLLAMEFAAAESSREEAQAFLYERDAAWAEVQSLRTKQASQAQELSMLAAETAAASSRREEVQALLYECDAAQAEVRGMKAKQFLHDDSQNSELRLWEAACVKLPMLQAQLQTCELEEGAARERCELVDGWLQGAAAEANEALTMARQMSTAEAACLGELAAASDAHTASMDEVRELRARLRISESSGGNRAGVALYEEARDEADMARGWHKKALELQGIEVAMQEYARRDAAKHELQVAQLQTELRSVELRELQAVKSSSF